MKLGRTRDTRDDEAEDFTGSAALKRAGLFSNVDPSQLHEMTQRVSRITYRDGERIVEEGDLGGGVLERP
jgi:hypothetical protein